MLDFPGPPLTTGQIFNGPGGVAWMWDGVKWIVGAGTPSTVVVADTSPAGVLPGTLWWSSLSGQLYVRYSDPTSSQWIIANNVGGGPYLALAGGTLSGGLVLAGNASANLNPVPLQQLNTTLASYATTASVASTYAPLSSPALVGTPTVPTAAVGTSTTQASSTAFVQSAVAPALNDVGRNYVQNAMFNVAQRGPGVFTTLQTYTLDRWVIGGVSDTVSVGQYGMTDTDRSQISDEAAQQKIANVFTGNAAAGANNNFYQSIERVARLSGKTVTVSFWAKTGSGALKLGLNIFQGFGSGGSPSAFLWVLSTGIAFTLSATWQRFSATISVPSIAGKTLGTNNNDSTGLTFFFSAGANTNAVAGNIGVQSGEIDLWGVQLEVGSVATPLEKIDPGEDIRRCQRFYQVGGIWLGGAATGVGQGIQCSALLPVNMRAQPTMTGTWSNSNLTSPSIQAVNNTVVTYAQATGNVQFAMQVYFTASADL